MSSIISLIIFMSYPAIPVEMPNFTTTSTETVFITTYIDKGIMADGSYTREGSVACSRKWELGTVLIIDNKFYTCRDRYNLRLDKERGRYTVDIWKDISYEEAIKEGKVLKNIIKIN